MRYFCSKISKTEKDSMKACKVVTKLVFVEI